MFNQTEQLLEEAENEGQDQQYFTTEEGGGLIAVGVKRGGFRVRIMGRD